MEIFTLAFFYVVIELLVKTHRQGKAEHAGFGAKAVSASPLDFAPETARVNGVAGAACLVQTIGEDDALIFDPAYSNLPGNIYNTSVAGSHRAGAFGLDDDMHFASATGHWQGDTEFMESGNIITDPAYFWMEENIFHHDIFPFSGTDNMTHDFNGGLSSGFDDTFSGSHLDDHFGPSSFGSGTGFDDW